MYLVLGDTWSGGVYLVLGGVPGPRGYLVWGEGVPCPGGVPGLGGCTWSQGGTWSGGMSRRGCLPGPGGVPGQVPPLDQVHPPGIRYTPRDQVPPVDWSGTLPSCGQTDTCKLITLPQTSFGGGNNRSGVGALDP